MESDSWKKTLYIMFGTELVVLTAFSFINPFLPLFVQQLGDFTDTEAALWSGIAVGGSSITMFISSPIWGMVADRWGRKPMVLRAMFGGSIIIAAMGLAPNIYTFIVLRWIQGMLTGTVAAASALVAANTPRHKISFAMGLIMLSSFIGGTLGPLLGGFIADKAGYQATFFITGAFLFTGGIVVFFFVHENFERPVRGQSISIGGLLRLAVSRKMLPLLIAMCALNIGPSMISPIIPLLIKVLNPTGAAATASGIAFGLMGLVAAISSLIAGRLGEHISLKKILIFSCVGTGLLYLPPIWATSVFQLLIFVGLTGLLKGGLMTSANALVGLSAAQTEQGVAYGLSHSAQALGGGLGPLIGGGLAPFLGFRPIFGVAAGLFLLVSILINKLLSGKPSEA